MRLADTLAETVASLPPSQIVSKAISNLTRESAAFTTNCAAELRRSDVHARHNSS
ncbi:MAG: hypothetical protein HWQ43_32600 [Nostoc sp. JL31]|uniref:hypothetical protein n=1 Tax=Nostoc sp. JL31 TaxID=2815395 RepID=UPI0025D70586|nr:hypothetical protein [Nostoc sp. JL31]MBN3893656.1 hypothetical protein [Nostoc sp. JL31]